MREDVRLDYLAALGVTNWVPRVELANAAARAPLVLPVAPALPAETESAVQTTPREVAAPATAPLGNSPIPVPRPAGSATRPKPPEPPAAEPVEQAAPAAAVPPFYMQLWLAGPCALLIETAEPGLESASSSYRLLSDILRAVELPVPPTLYADFRWPLVRSRQLDTSALAASEGLQSFMQARLEGRGVISLGCFGELTALLADAEPKNLARMLGREEALEHLPPAWFAPALDTLIAEPLEKARLWQLLKRVRPRWIDRE